MSKLEVLVTTEEEAPTLWDMIVDTVYADLKNGGRDSDEPVYCERSTGFTELMTHYGE
jgi:hypothetical protein